MLALAGASAAHEARLKAPERLAALRATGLLETQPEPAFDRLARLAARCLRAPVALVAEQRLRFKGAHGVGKQWSSERRAPLSHSFCPYVVSSAEPLVLHDARAHAQLRGSPAITELKLVAYAGVPLLGAGRRALGALCVGDSRPHKWTDEDVSLLRELAELAQAELAQRERLRALEQAEAARQAAEAALAHSPAALRHLARNLPDHERQRTAGLAAALGWRSAR